MALEAAAGLRSSGADVLVRTVPGPFSELIAGEGFESDLGPFPVLRRVMVGPAWLLRTVLLMPRDVMRLYRELRTHRPTAVLVNTLASPHWLLAARLARVRTVCYVHEDERRQPRFVRSLLTSQLLLAHRVIAISQSVATFAGESWRTVGPRTSVVYNALATDTSPATAWPKRDGRRRLVLVGRLSEAKGQDLAIEAVRVLVDRGHNVELELAGDVFPGYEHVERALRSLVARLDLNERVVFRGWVADPRGLIASADIVLVPSRNEPFGLVAMEAMMRGKPVVTSDAGGLPEVVRADVDGLVVPSDDVVALSEAIDRLLTDRALATRLATEGSRVRERFSTERYRDGMAEAVLTAK
jgi:glycosyltransferase involved in cell wall biosynthesis